MGDRKGGDKVAKKKNEIRKADEIDSIDHVINEIVENMTNLGVYRAEFYPTVERYAEVKILYKIAWSRWVANGMKITAPYTNKGGECNERTTAEYAELKKMREELTYLELVLGLNPKGLKAIQSKALDGKKRKSSFLSDL